MEAVEHMMSRPPRHARRPLWPVTRHLGHRLPGHAPAAPLKRSDTARDTMNTLGHLGSQVTAAYDGRWPPAMLPSRVQTMSRVRRPAVTTCVLPAAAALRVLPTAPPSCCCPPDRTRCEVPLRPGEAHIGFAAKVAAPSRFLPCVSRAAPSGHPGGTPGPEA